MVVGALAVEAFHGGHGDDTDTRLASGGLDGVLKLGACRDDDGFEGSFFFLGDVSASASAFAAGGDVELLLGHDLLARKDEGGRSVGAEEGRGPSAGDFLGVSGANDVEVWNHAQATDGLDRLVSGAVFTDTNGVVGEDIDDGEFSQSGEADGRAHVVGEDEEGRAAGTEEAVVGDAVANRAHGVLADTEPDVFAFWSRSAVVAGVLEVVLGRTVKVSRTGDKAGDELGDFIDDHAACATSGVCVVVAEGWDGVAKVARNGSGDAVLKLFRQLGVGGGPGIVSGLPSVEGCFLLFGFGGKVSFHFVGDVEGVCRKAESSARAFGKVGSAFAVAFGCASNFGDTATDFGLGDDDGGLAVLGVLCGFEGCSDGGVIVTVDSGGVPVE